MPDEHSQLTASPPGWIGAQGHAFDARRRPGLWAGSLAGGAKSSSGNA